MKSKSQPAALYCGIDVSGDTLDICYQIKDGTFQWAKVPNNPVGFKQIWKLTGKSYHLVIKQIKRMRFISVCMQLSIVRKRT